MTTIPTEQFVHIAPTDPSATAPLPAESAAPASRPTTTLPPLPAWRYAWLIWSDRLARSWPGLVLGLLIATLAAAALWPRSSVEPAIIFAPSPLRSESRAMSPSPTPVLAVPTPAGQLAVEPVLPPAQQAQIVYVAQPAPPAPAAELLPTIEAVQPTPAPVVVYVQQQPAPPEPIRVEPAGDGGQWLIVEESAEGSRALYEPPPGATPVPTPYYGEFNGGGGSWDD